jgi:hypothetical protein
VHKVADILLSSDDLTVFGGPAEISLDLDIGTQGDRGSLIIGVLGDPRDTSVASTIVQETQALDIAIDYSPYSTTYKTVFQKVSTGGAPQWTPLLTLKTNYYSSVKDVTAVAGNDGIGIITIPPINLSEIADEINLTSADFSIQYSISSSGGGPVLTSLVVSDVVDSPIRALPLEIKGIEYNGTTWVPMAGPKRVHLFITVV